MRAILTLGFHILSPLLEVQKDLCMDGASFLLKILVLFTISLQNDHMEALEAPIWIQIKQKVSRMKFNIFSKILGP